MDFKIPKELQDYLDELDQFIENEIMPIQNRDDNIRFFDHRREHARTDWDNNGLPRKDWEAAARRSARGRRQSRTPALRMAEETRRQRRLEPVDGGDPRAPGGERSRTLQRPADRALDRRQQPVHRDVRGVRHAGSVQALQRRPAERPPAHRLRPHRTESRLRRDVHGNEGGAADEERQAGLAHQRREDVDHRDASRELRHDVRAHRAATTATRAASPASSSRRTRPA